ERAGPAQLGAQFPYSGHLGPQVVECADARAREHAGGFECWEIDGKPGISPARGSLGGLQATATYPDGRRWRGHRTRLIVHSVEETAPLYHPPPSPPEAGCLQRVGAS